MPIALSVLEGPHSGRVYTFDGHDTFLVGRAPEAHFHLADDPYFSRMHLLVEVNPPLCRLTDLGSRNGTLVNDRKVSTIPLNHGDKIRGGKTLLHVAITQDDGAKATLDLPRVPELAPPTAGARPTSTLQDPDPLPRQLEGKTASYIPNASDPFPAIPGYTIAGKLGSGAMGIVYRAIRENGGAEVALKTIQPAVVPTETVVGRFLREVEVLKGLSHPNIVSFHEMGTATGLLFFAMEFVPGSDANQHVKRNGPIAIHQAVDLIAQVLEGLDHAHKRGIVHRDIKPANLLIVEKAGRLTAKIADFGLGRTYQNSQLSGLTMSGVSGGTPLFMPPEQITDFRNAQPAADQYSAAATLYYLLTGVGPHIASKVEELFKKLLLEEPTPIHSRKPEVSAALEKAIHRALSRKAEQRFADVAAFRKAILEAA